MDGLSRSQSGTRAAPKKPGHGATYSVVVMTLAALAGVGVLAAQAAATAPKVSNNATAQNGGASTHQPPKNGTPGTGTASAPAPNPLALPGNSGSGLRIVYGLGARRVWLVSAANAVVRTFQIVPGTVHAPTGSYGVTNRLSESSGTDGTPVQYVVIFDESHSTAFGFDAVANVTGLPPAPTGHTGGIRMAQADAQALWNFSNYGTTVVVVP